MKKWSNGAKKRLVEIRAAEDGEQDMRTIAASIAKGLRTISEPFQASPGRAGATIASSDDEIRAREIKRARNGLEAAKARGDKGMVKEMEEKLKKLGVS